MNVELAKQIFILEINQYKLKVDPIDKPAIQFVVTGLAP